MTYHAHSETAQKTNKTPLIVIAAVFVLGALPFGYGIYMGATSLGTELEAQSMSVDKLMKLAREDAASNNQISNVLYRNDAAADRIQALADNGDMYAQTMWCWIQANGVSMDPNPEKGVKYCEKAAVQGHGPALQNMGYYYSAGIGVSPNSDRSKSYYKEAYDVFLIAAETGHPRSQYRIANMHKHGWVETNWNVAWEYFEKAADNDYPPALYEMGRGSYDGNAFPRDYTKAAEYFQRAADQHYAPAYCKLSHLYREGAGVKQDITKANKLREYAVIYNVDHAVYDLAMALKDGVDVKQDLKRSHELMVVSAVNGNKTAMSIAGQNFLDGVGTPVDRAAGLYWLESAAELGQDNAKRRLTEERLPKKDNYKDAEKTALAYMNGDGVEKDLGQELTWMVKAAAQGSTIAKMRLSKRYETGEGVQKSDVNALYWMVHLADIRPSFQYQVKSLGEGMSPAQLERAQKLYDQCDMSKFLTCIVDEI